MQPADQVYIDWRAQRVQQSESGTPEPLKDSSKSLEENELEMNCNDFPCMKNPYLK